MAGRLKCSCICLSIFLLVIPLVCSEDAENKGKDDMEELLQNLLKAAKERRQQSDDTNAKGSGVTEQGDTNDNENGPEIKTQELSKGLFKSDVSQNKELQQEIIQDCANKYELMLVKNADSTGGSCYLHKMNERIYQKDCLGMTTEGEIKIKYENGQEIQNTTLLSSIKGIEGCMGKPVIEMVESSMIKRDFDEYEKRLAEKRGCTCVWYLASCYEFCAQTSGWWWGEVCVKKEWECIYNCQIICR